MTSENIGETEDLALNEEDAENVVGGKKKAKKKVVTKTHKVQVITAPAVPAAPIQSETEQQAQYDQDMIDHGVDPPYGTTGTSGTS